MQNLIFFHFYLNILVPKEYFCPLEPSGRRHDQNSRPELSKGSVEFVATAEYMERPPHPASYLFAIDVSYTSITSGMLASCISSIERVLESLPTESNTKIGILTFDSSIHFYNLNVRSNSLSLLHIIPL